MALDDEELAAPDPWRGFRHLIEGIFELHARVARFTEAFASTFPEAADVAAKRGHSLRATAELVRRASRIGSLRPEFAVGDLVLVLTPTGVCAARRPDGSPRS